MIKVIVGLGNPGPKFENTRHNVGFAIIDKLAENNNLSWQQKDNYLEADFNGMMLIKPLTFMNLSGQALTQLHKKGILPEEILVIHDELELPFGQIKIKKGGSHKGHNGLRSIIEKIGPDFYRLRFGISKPTNRDDVPNYVLEKFNSSEKVQIPELIEKSISNISNLLQDSANIG